MKKEKKIKILQFWPLKSIPTRRHLC